MVEETPKLSMGEQAQSRVIHSNIDVTLIPPQGELGATDAAWDACHLLIDGALHLLQQAAERNGFKVKINVRNWVG